MIVYREMTSKVSSISEYLHFVCYVSKHKRVVALLNQLRLSVSKIVCYYAHSLADTMSISRYCTACQTIFIMQYLMSLALKT